MAALDGLRILVLEDEALVALDLEWTLDSAGASDVKVAMRLAEAGTILETWMPDLAILDVCLPDGESPGLAARLRTLGVAIVFHTGNADASSLRDAVPEAVVLRKPADPDGIVKAVDAAFVAIGRTDRLAAE